MRRLAGLITTGLLTTAVLAGCRDSSPPTPTVPPPRAGIDTPRYDYDRPKPLPPQYDPRAAGSIPFDDPPLMIDTPPEARQFVDIYRKVGRPRIVVFVNRTLEGEMVPATDPRPTRVVDVTRSATTGVRVETRDYSSSEDRLGRRTRENLDKFESDGAGEYTERKTVYLKPGEYDDLSAKAIDYEMMELLLTDWLSADSQVTIMSPRTARRNLTEQQVRDLEAGRPQVLAQVASQLDADVLVQLQARPTRQAGGGALELRILGEAIDLGRGESLARGGVDMQPPLDKVQVNTYMRFLARKLMDGMSATWSAPPPAQQEN